MNGSGQKKAVTGTIRTKVTKSYASNLRIDLQHPGVCKKSSSSLVFCYLGAEMHSPLMWSCYEPCSTLASYEHVSCVG